MMVVISIALAMARRTVNHKALIGIKQHPNEMIDLLLRRRSVKVTFQTQPAPGKEDLETILRCAIRVPDHKKLTPWRIQVLQGQAQENLGKVFAEVFAAQNPDAEPKRIEFERQRPLRAPLLLIVSTKIESDRAPRWEQILSGAAVCQNILISATALGYASQWLSEWVNYDEAVKRHLAIAESDEILGFIYIGTASEAPTERPRPELNDIVSYL